MTHSSLQPLSFADLDPTAMAAIPRAGSPAEQASLHAQAWAMLEPHRPTTFRSISRLSRAWLAPRSWRVHLLPHDLTETPYALENLARTAAGRGHETLLGADVSPWTTRPSAVWRLPLDPARIARFFLAHSLGCHLLFAADRSFAIHADDSGLAAFAAPEPLLRALIPPPATPRPDLLDDPRHALHLAQYGPFLLW